MNSCQKPLKPTIFYLKSNELDSTTDKIKTIQPLATTMSRYQMKVNTSTSLLTPGKQFRITFQKAPLTLTFTVSTASKKGSNPSIASSSSHSRAMFHQSTTKWILTRSTTKATYKSSSLKLAAINTRTFKSWSMKTHCASSKQPKILTTLLLYGTRTCIETAW